MELKSFSGVEDKALSKKRKTLVKSGYIRIKRSTYHL